jgi:hypothetical protein
MIVVTFRHFAMAGTKVCLSARGLGNVPVDESQNNFEFRVGKQRYGCRSVIADFLSRKISTLHAIDSTAESIDIQTVDDKGRFAIFLSLGRGCEITISESDSAFFKSLSLELGNIELFELINSKEELTIENAIESFRLHVSSGLGSSREIDFIAQHFYELFSSSRESILSGLEAAELIEILNAGSLRIESEESLSEFFSRRFSADETNFCLFEFIRFEYLPVSVMRDFIAVSEAHYDLMTSSIWKSICVRLAYPISPSQPNDRIAEVFSGQLFEYHSNSPLNGIIAYLTKKFGGNIHTKGVIAATSKDPFGNDVKYPSTALDYENTNYYYSENLPGQWICFDFKGMTIQPTHYSIRTYTGDGPGGRHLRDWVLEGSLDGSNWGELDRRSNNSDLNARDVIRTFTISISGRCRFIRLRQTGKNHRGDDYLLFYAFEVFGRLRE